MSSSSNGFSKQQISQPSNSGRKEEGLSSEWEVRPGGMLVQKRDLDADVAHAGPSIRVKVSYGRCSHYVSINAHSTFGELKKSLVQETGLQPKQQRLLYKKKERKDNDYLFEAGVKDKSKIVLVEDAANWEKGLLESRKNEAAAKASKAVAESQQFVDKLSGQIANIEAAILGGKHLSDGELVGLIDSLMYQLVILDASKVEGNIKVQKTILIRRVQKYVEKLDALKVKNDRLNARSAISKGQNGVSRSITANGKSHIPSAVTANGKAHTSSAVTTAATTSWETVGTNMANLNLSTRPSPVSEPLLIQWD